MGIVPFLSWHRLLLEAVSSSLPPVFLSPLVVNVSPSMYLSHGGEDGVLVDPKPHVLDDLFVERLVALFLLASFFKHLVVLLHWVRLDLAQDLFLLFNHHRDVQSKILRVNSVFDEVTTPSFRAFQSGTCR